MARGPVMKGRRVLVPPKYCETGPSAGLAVVIVAVGRKKCRILLPRPANAEIELAKDVVAAFPAVHKEFIAGLSDSEASDSEASGSDSDTDEASAGVALQPGGPRHCWDRDAAKGSPKVPSSQAPAKGKPSGCTRTAKNELRDAGKGAAGFVAAFLLFFTPAMLAMAVRCTNQYAEKYYESQGADPAVLWTPVTESELKSWLGIHLSMSIIKLPRYRLYWDTSDNLVYGHTGGPPSRTLV